MIPDTGIQEPTNWPIPSLKWYTLTRPQVVQFARPLTAHYALAEYLHIEEQPVVARRVLEDTD